MPGRLRRSYDKHWYAWAMVLPTVIVLGLLVLYPLFQGIYQSFTDLNESNQRSEICTKTLAGGDLQTQPRRCGVRRTATTTSTC